MPDGEKAVTRGSCLCGAVGYTVTGPLRPVIACHCTQCRKQTGHYYATTGAPDEAVAIEDPGSLKWYESSDFARRGFCAECGSALFWKRNGSAETGILAGTIDGPTGLKLAKHIFCADKGDYYELADDLPHLAKF
jgi:hypothetical protein